MIEGESGIARVSRREKKRRNDVKKGESDRVMECKGRCDKLEYACVKYDSPNISLNKSSTLSNVFVNNCTKHNLQEISIQLAAAALTSRVFPVFSTSDTHTLRCTNM